MEEIWKICQGLFMWETLIAGYAARWMSSSRRRGRRRGHDARYSTSPAMDADRILTSVEP